MSGKKIKAIEFNKFDGVANKTTFSEIKTHLFSCKRIDLFPSDLIVRLDIPWGELYCVCTDAEWSELYKILHDNNINISRWTFLDSILDILSFFFVQPIGWLSDFLGRIKGKRMGKRTCQQSPASDNDVIIGKLAPDGSLPGAKGAKGTG